MQLKRTLKAAERRALRRRRLRRAQLAAATLSLLGAAAPAQAGLFERLFGGGAQPLEESRPWEFDTAVLVYSESGGRVQAVEPVLKVSRDLGGERILSTKLVVDALTGASPNGATPASTPQTFSGPSGDGHRYTAAAGETPLDDSFKDTRVSLSADYLFPVSEDGKLGLGINASKEYDFLSAGVSARYSLDFNQGNTTLSAGLSYEADRIDAVGGIPRPLAQMGAAGSGDDESESEDDDREGGGSRSKGVTDLVLGVTQVLDPQSLVQFNVSLSRSSGYQNDPYKILSVVGADGEPLRYVNESRPDARSKQALFGRYKRFLFGRDVADASYRFMTDDWGIVSHTADVGYRWNFGEHQYLEPHLRWYSQSAANFYRAALYDGEEASVRHASADPRLGAFDAYTVGLKYGRTLASGNEWSARLEAYRQSGKAAGVPEQAAAGLSKFNLEPDLSAAMLTLGYRFNW